MGRTQGQLGLLLAALETKEVQESLVSLKRIAIKILEDPYLESAEFILHAHGDDEKDESLRGDNIEDDTVAVDSFGNGHGGSPNCASSRVLPAGTN